MGFFTRDGKSKEEQRYDELRKLLAEENVINKKTLELKIWLESYHDHPTDAVIRPFSLFMDLIEMLRRNTTDFNMTNYGSTLNYAQKIYKGMFIYEEETPNFEQLCLVFLEFFDVGGIGAKRLFDGTFFLLFHNPENYIRWYRGLELESATSLQNIWKYYVGYGVVARSLFPDEDMFTANLIHVTGRLLRSTDAEKAYQEEVKNLYHFAGIYDVDEATILRVEQQLLSGKDVVERAKGIMERVDNQINTIGDLADAAVDRVREATDAEIQKVKNQADNLEVRITEAEKKIVEDQKKVILFQKDELVNQIIADSEARLRELSKTAQATISAAKLELSRVNRESDDTMSKIEEYFKTHADLEKLMDSASKEQELREKIDKLTVLNDRNIEAMLRNNETKQEPVKQEAASVTIVEKKVVNAPLASDDAVAAPIEYEDPTEIPDVNPMFDETVSFQTRYAAAMEKKKAMEKAGEHFHKMFDDVLIAVMENANPYLIGPSGCGKTFMVSQIARILGAEFIDIGYINEEYDILGFQTANGGYSRPNFYRCYKYGKIAFCDELDNGNSRATVKLNSFLSNVKDAGYNFPNGEHVTRHPNFRVIGAGNTSGNGADSNYNTREKIEESVQQRFTPIYVDYDNSVEKSILGDYKDWYEFVCCFRNATNAWSASTHSSAPGIITTRDVTRIRRYLDNKSFSTEKIIDYEFVQTKDEDYLAFLSQHMNSAVKGNAAAGNLVKAFSEKVEQIRSGKVIRG